jgi:hypothetical protein
LQVGKVFEALAVEEISRSQSKRIYRVRAHQTIPTSRRSPASKLKLNPECGMKKPRMAGTVAACGLLWVFVCGLTVAAGQSQPPPKSAPPAAEDEASAPLAGDWAPDLLYNVWNSSNSQASEALYDAAFAAGPSVIPDLEAALRDDRTAEFAAQSLAFIGGNRAMEILAKLVNDPRDLGLKRFFYGALAEVDSPEATRVLLDAIAHADAEPDRTITEAAILALTVRSDMGLIPQLRDLESKVQDPVIRDDLENAADVISARGKYLASPEGRDPDYSLDRAVRTYFIPALETPAAEPAKGSTSGRSAAAKAHPVKPESPGVSVKIEHLTLSPDQTRALARVAFEVPSAIAHYDMVLEKRAGNWRLASVWLGSEEEKLASQ